MNNLFLMQSTQPVTHISIDSVTQLVIAITALLVAIPGIVLGLINAWHAAKAKALALVANAAAQEVKTQVAVTDAKANMLDTRITNTSNALDTVRSDLNTTSKNSTSPEMIQSLLNATPGTAPQSEVPDGKDSNQGVSKSP